MPLFEIGNDELIPFRRVKRDRNYTRKRSRGLLWANLDSFVGVSCFRLRVNLRSAMGFARTSSRSMPMARPRHW